MRRTRLLGGGITLIALVATGCGVAHDSPGRRESATDVHRSVRSSSSPSPHPETSGSANATRPQEASLSNRDLVGVVKATRLPIARITVRDENNDPENLIGRPCQYTSRVDWQDSRRKMDPDFPNAPFAGILEVYPTPDDARMNADRLVRFGKALPGWATYVYQAGPVLLQVGGDMKPSQAEQYRSAMSKALRAVGGSTYPDFQPPVE
jgi:hypothetical protein